MDKYVVFHNAADDSYMNSAANFRGAYAATETIDIYFDSPLTGAAATSGANMYDKITCAVTNGEEDRAIEQFAQQMAGAGPKSRVTVIADDVNSVYACQDILSVTTISTANTGQTKRIKTWAADTTLVAGDSGSWIYASDATAGDLTLPAAAAGLEFHIFIAIAQTGDTHITVPSGYFIGGLEVNDLSGTAGEQNMFFSDGNSNDWINLDADTKGRLAGGYINIICDGTNWHVQGNLVGDGTLATPFADAES